MDLSSRLNKVSYTIIAIKPLMSLNSMRMIYHSYAHSILSYGIIFAGNAPYNEYFQNSKKNNKSFYQFW
jgi:hypothetical protein